MKRIVLSAGLVMLFVGFLGDRSHAQSGPAGNVIQPYDVTMRGTAADQGLRDVVINVGGVQIHADKLTIDLTTHKMLLDGNVTLQAPDQSLLSNAMARIVGPQGQATARR
jgi:hypothetical protein